MPHSEPAPRSLERGASLTYRPHRVANRPVGSVSTRCQRLTCNFPGTFEAHPHAPRVAIGSTRRHPTIVRGRLSPRWTRRATRTSTLRWDGAPRLTSGPTSSSTGSLRSRRSTARRFPTLIRIGGRPCRVRAGTGLCEPITGRFRRGGRRSQSHAYLTRSGDQATRPLPEGRVSEEPSGCRNGRECP